MYLANCREIRLDKHLWEPELFGVFTRCNNGVTFYFINRQILYAYEDNQTSPDVLGINSNGLSFPLPYDWRLIETSTSSFLLLGELLGVNLAEKTLISPVPHDLLVEYKKHTFPEKYFEEASFCFDNYYISHKGASGYTCTKLGKHLWDFQGRAYLYTEIKQYRDRVFFGTAGLGGYFYVLDLESGTPIAKIKTGGTSCIERIGDRCYFLQHDGKTRVLCVDLQSGKIVDSVILPGKSSELSRLQVIDNILHAITFHYQNSNLIYAIWNTVQL